MSVIFAANLENNNFNEFTSTVTDSGDLSVSTDAKLGYSNYGIKCVINDTTAIYGQKVLASSNTSGTIRLRFYVDFNSISLPLYDGLICLKLYNSVDDPLLAVWLRNETVPYIQIVYWGDGSIYNGFGDYATDDVHCVEILYKRATTNLSSDGSLEVWIDNVKLGDVHTNIDNYDKFNNFSYVNMGANDIPASTSGTFFIDELVIKDDNSEIGLCKPYYTKTGSFNIDTTKTATQTQSITGLGFQPKIVMFFWGGSTSTTDSVSGGNINHGFGAATSSTNRFCIDNMAQDALATTDVFSSGKTTEIFRAYTAASGTLDGILDFASMDIDGFTLTIDDQFANAYRISYFALGGRDLTNTYIGNKAMPSGTGNYSASGVGFQPDALLSVTRYDALEGSGAIVNFTVGMASGSGTQGNIWVYELDGQATAYNCGHGNNDEIHASPETGDYETFVGFTSDGFTLNHTAGGGGGYFYYICLKGGRYSVGDILTRTDGNDISETVGFQPVGILFASANRAESSAHSYSQPASISIGAATSGSNRAVAAAWDASGVADSQTAKANYDTSVYANIDNDAIVGLMDLKSIDSTGFTCVMDDVDPGACWVTYLAIGESPPIIEASASLSAISQITAVGTKTSGGVTHDGAANLLPISEIISAGTLVHAVWDGAGNLNTTSEIIASGSISHATWDGQAALSTNSQITAAGTLTHALWDGSASLAATSSIIISMLYPEDYILRNMYFGKRGTLVGYWQRISYYDTHEAYATFNGNSLLTANGIKSVDGVLTLTATSEILLNATAVKNISASLSATSEIITNGKRYAEGSLVLSAFSEIISTSKVSRDASSALSGTSEISVSGKRYAEGNAVLSVNSESIAASKVTRDAFALLLTTSDFIVQAKTAIGASANLQAESQMIIFSTGDKLAYANLVANSELNSSAKTTCSGASNLQTASELISSGKKVIDGLTALIATSEMSITGLRYTEGSISLSGLSEIRLSAIGYKEAYASLSSNSELITSGIRYINTASTLQANSQLETNAIKYINSGAELNTLSQLISTGQNVISGFALLSALSSIVTDSSVTHPLDYILRNTYFGKRGMLVGYWQILSTSALHDGTANIAGTSELTVEVSGEQLGAAGLSALSMLTISAKAVYGGYSDLSGTSELLSLGRITLNSSSNLSTNSEIFARGKVNFGAYTNIQALSELVITSSGDRLGFASLSAESILGVLAKAEYANYANLNTLSEIISFGRKTINTSANINAASQLLSNAIKYVQTTGDLSGLSALLISAFGYKEAYSALSGTSQLLSLGSKYINGISGLQGNSQLLVSAIKYLNAISLLTANSQTTVLGKSLLSGRINFGTFSELLLVTAGDKNGFANLSGESLLVSLAKGLYAGYSDLNGNSSILSSGKTLIGAGADLYVNSQLLSVGKTDLTGNIGIQTLSEILLSTKVDRPAFVGLSGLSELTPFAGIRFDGLLSLNGFSSLLSLGKKEINVLSNLFGISELKAIGQNLIGGAAAFDGNSELTAEVLLMALVCILKQSYINRSIRYKSKIDKVLRTDEWYRR